MRERIHRMEIYKLHSGKASPRPLQPKEENQIEKQSKGKKTPSKIVES